MTLQMIKYVAEIAKAGSISAAAQTLYLTQPYLSSVLRNLENELKISIFNREHNGVSLTDSGREFLYYAMPMLEQEERISLLYKNQDVKAALHFNISTQRFPFIIKAFYEFYKEICPDSFEIHVRETGMDQVIRDVFEKRSELGVISISTLTERFILKYLDQYNIQFNELVCTTPCVFFHRDHPMAKYDEVDIAHMYPYPFVSFESAASVSLDFSEEMIISEAPKFIKHFYVIDRATVINILTNTDAFSIGSGILSHGFAGPELVSRPIKNHANELKLGWIYNNRSSFSDECNVFIKNVKKVLEI